MSDLVSLDEFFKKFPDEKSATAFVEKWFWPNGVVCPYCGSAHISTCKKSSPMPYRCKECRKHFSVRIGTIFSESKLPLQKWLLAMYLLTSCKKGISSVYLAHQLGCTQKTAWFLAHRIRETWEINSPKLFGIVEVDEAYIGGKEANKHSSKKINKGRGVVGKTPVVGIKCRDGRVKTVIVEAANSANLTKTIEDNVLYRSKVYTDQNTAYNSLQNYYHETVNHNIGEYARGIISTNGIESYWAILKRGYYGIYHYWSVKHLHRYINEFQERFNMKNLSGIDKIINSIKRTLNKRLKYRDLINV